MLNNVIVLAVVTSTMTAVGDENDSWPSLVQRTKNASIQLLVNNVSDIENGTDSVLTSGSPNANVTNTGNGLETRVALYVVIFVLSVLGNLLVIMTLVQNKRMRTVTNVLLLNLAISDLLLSAFCMPFTLVGAVRREFIFGPAMCKMIPYLQGLSVSVGVWTLRYFAICQPLRSRRWQTLSHVYKMIAAVWLLSIISMLPIVFVSQLLPLRNERKFKCREVWPSACSTKIFTIFLDVILLIVPLAIMVLAYCLISKTLYRGMQQEADQSERTGIVNNAISLTSMKDLEVVTNERNISRSTCLANGKCERKWTTQPPARINQPKVPAADDIVNRATMDNHNPPFRRIIRRTNLDKSLAAKRRVIRMLFVVVLEFFVCWTPLYVLNTLALFSPELVYGGLGQRTISLVQLLAYVSTCCNPITYCFMHKKFRQSFLTVFGCGRRRRRRLRRQQQQTSGNDGSFYLSRQSTMRTETVCLDKNDDNVSRQMRLLIPSPMNHQSAL